MQAGPGKNTPTQVADDHLYDIMNISIDPVQSRRYALPPIGADSSGDSQCSDLCTSDSSSGGGDDSSHDLVKDPYQLAPDRRQKWPKVKEQYSQIHALQIYQKVKATGLPNMLGAREVVPSMLKHSVWQQIGTGHQNDEFIFDGIRFGFPIQYTGPPLSRKNKQVHASAKDYMPQVKQYLDAEISNRAMLGPYPESPFSEWLNISPLMTRPKADPAKRRIIVDLSYPKGDNVNSFVNKNTIFARHYEHRLPTIQDTVSAIQQKGYRVLLATIDVERAYRNVPSCPLDYPLLGISVEDMTYIDTAMPFGSRNSSLYMQMLADHIVRALRLRGITCQMYLDDMVLQLGEGEDPHTRFMEVTTLYRALGLPIAYSKIQAPAPTVTYLGIIIDVKQRMLAIPRQKIQQFVELIRWALGQKKISRRMVQRLIGKINFLSRCVHPARLFMGRILNALRAAGEQALVIPVAGMRADLHWFLVFLARYNGRSMMKPSDPQKVILADSCLSGGGATDMVRAYSFEYTHAIASSHHITTLEALNCLVACRTLISAKDRHSTIELMCDNRATIDAMAFGRAKDPVLAAICRAMWYLMAQMDIRLVFTHVPGERMGIPDALSRAHLSQLHQERAQTIIETHQLAIVTPKKFATNYKNFL